MKRFFSVLFLPLKIEAYKLSQSYIYLLDNKYALINMSYKITSFLFVFFVFCTSGYANCSSEEIFKIKSVWSNNPNVKITFLSKDDKCRFTANHFGRFEETKIYFNDQGMGLNTVGDGPTIQWYDNRQKKSEFNVVMDKITGLKTTWHKNGVKQSEANYSNNVIEGKETIWNDKGEKISEVMYVNGLLAENQINKKNESEPQEISIEKYIRLKETRGVIKKIESSVSLPSVQSEVDEIAAKYCWSQKQYPENIEQMCEPCGIDNTKLFFDLCKKTEKYRCESSKLYTISFGCTSSGGYDSSDRNNIEQEKIVVDEKEIKLKEVKEKKLAKEKLAKEKMKKKKANGESVLSIYRWLNGEKGIRLNYSSLRLLIQ